MFIYSGTCRDGICGTPTGKESSDGQPLFVGDIVVVMTRDKDGYVDFFPDNLTAMVSNRFTSFSDGTHKEKEGDVEFFAMGIKDGGDKWHIMKLKDHSDVIDGENWQAYGFNYKND